MACVALAFGQGIDVAGYVGLLGVVTYLVGFGLGLSDGPWVATRRSTRRACGGLGQAAACTANWTANVVRRRASRRAPPGCTGPCRGRRPVPQCVGLCILRGLSRRLGDDERVSFLGEDATRLVGMPVVEPPPTNWGGQGRQTPGQALELGSPAAWDGWSVDGTPRDPSHQTCCAVTRPWTFPPLGGGVGGALDELRPVLLDHLDLLEFRPREGAALDAVALHGALEIELLAVELVRHALGTPLADRLTAAAAGPPAGRTTVVAPRDSAATDRPVAVAQVDADLPGHRSSRSLRFATFVSESTAYRCDAGASPRRAHAHASRSPGPGSCAGVSETDDLPPRRSAARVMVMSLRSSTPPEATAKAGHRPSVSQNAKLLSAGLWPVQSPNNEASSRVTSTDRVPRVERDRRRRGRLGRRAGRVSVASGGRSAGAGDASGASARRLLGVFVPGWRRWAPPTWPRCRTAPSLLAPIIGDGRAGRPGAPAPLRRSSSWSTTTSAAPRRAVPRASPSLARRLGNQKAGLARRARRQVLLARRRRAAASRNGVARSATTQPRRPAPRPSRSSTQTKHPRFRVQARVQTWRCAEEPADAPPRTGTRTPVPPRPWRWTRPPSVPGAAVARRRSGGIPVGPCPTNGGKLQFRGFKSPGTRGRSGRSSPARARRRDPMESPEMRSSSAPVPLLDVLGPAWSFDQLSRRRASRPAVPRLAAAPLSRSSRASWPPTASAPPPPPGRVRPRPRHIITDPRRAFALREARPAATDAGGRPVVRSVSWSRRMLCSGSATLGRAMWRAHHDEDPDGGARRSVVGGDENVDGGLAADKAALHHRGRVSASPIGTGDGDFRYSPVTASKAVELGRRGSPAVFTAAPA